MPRMQKSHRAVLTLNDGRCQTSDQNQNQNPPAAQPEASPSPAPPLTEMAGPVSSAPRTVEDIYKDYAARRAGLVRALTSGNVEDSPPPSTRRSPCFPFSRAPLLRISRLTPCWFPLAAACRCRRVLQHVRPR
jgi:hypothetical protein